MPCFLSLALEPNILMFGKASLLATRANRINDEHRTIPATNAQATRKRKWVEKEKQGEHYLIYHRSSIFSAIEECGNVETDLHLLWMPL